MKSTLKILSLFLAVSSLFVTQACTSDEETLADKSLIISSGLTEMLTEDANALTAATFVSTDSLTADEIEELYFMREEEKLAYDIYTSFNATYALTIFDRISNSELRHTEKILELINFYNLTDPALAAAGSFSNPDLQQLYTDLLTAGNVSVEDALQVGALIEEVDILDLLAALDNTSNANLITVYTNLLNGSKRHLQAFVRVLDSYGITYTPQELDQTTFDDILSENFFGNGGHGGNGHHHGHHGSNGSHGSGSGTCDGTGSSN